MNKILLLLVLLLGGCASDGWRDWGDTDSGPDLFDEKTMFVRIVDDSALPVYCAKTDGRHIYGCAIPWPGGTCTIYIGRQWELRPDSFVRIRKHEAKHCKGLHHPGE